MGADGPDLRSLESKLHALLRPSSTVLESTRVGEILPSILDLATQLIAAEACAIWRFHGEDESWRIAASVGLSSEYRNIPIHSPDHQTPGGSPYCFEDTSQIPVPSSRSALYAAEGIRSLVAIPIRIGGEPSSTLAFYYRQPHRFSNTEIGVAGSLAALAASALEIAVAHMQEERARVEAELARQRSAFLAEASAVLSGSLDYEVTLGAVANLAVQRNADWCMVGIAGQGGHLKRVALAHRDAAQVEWARQFSRTYPRDPNGDWGPLLVLRTGKSELLPGPNGAMDQKTLRSVGFTSSMCVPMAVQGRVLGTIIFGSTQSAWRYNLDELSRLELQIMEALWSRGPCSVREILETFPKKGRPAYTTVQTTVYRLEAKKALRRVKKISTALIFEAAISRTAAERRLIDELLSLFGGRTSPVMAHLVESGKLTLAEVREAEKTLLELDREGSKRKEEER